MSNVARLEVLATAFVNDKIFALRGNYAVLIGGYRRFGANFRFYLQGVNQSKIIILGGSGTLGGTGQLSRYSDSLRAGRSWDRIPMGAIFSAPVQTGRGAPPSLVYNGYRIFPGDKAAEAWR